MEEPLIPLASEDSDLGDGGDFESFSGKYWLLLIFLLLFLLLLLFVFCVGVILFQLLLVWLFLLMSLYSCCPVVNSVVIIGPLYSFELFLGTEEEEEDLASISANSK